MVGCRQPFYVAVKKNHITANIEGNGLLDFCYLERKNNTERMIQTLLNIDVYAHIHIHKHEQTNYSSVF